ncbi:peptidyl-prolyl cis-trans isomerase D [Legionella quinlivanii]|uniref:Periplasmic chaperone PpiD n=1 Tax=Legionella quinlivanii TaxID=45073 RepID=A0A0W0Y029_9GAMM|nr:SurA N-terminal domain-containing protein [Legionella quinlivanii]KTD50233.1 peptidyl-prolyl cis-trans isomerase D [Legionella quinlivanii]SEF46570.1 peptidyl-prolyl cis-trans isomerase D [Legionella quinlivanii DSM 21216]STY11832.1 peptidyl-prolyl cis-trans isomerase D [Legionella quinlivanii]
MLQKLNERIQGLVAWIVIILIAVTFTLFGVDYYMQSHQASDAEVTVNDQPISKQAFEINYRRARQQRDPSEMSTESDVALKKEVLDGMVMNEVTVQAAQAAGFGVSIEQANAAIQSIPQFQQDGHFSAERYQQALSGAMFTPESFQKEVRQGMLLNQQRFAFIGTAFALPSEVKRFVKLYMQTRDYDYLQISTRLFMDKSQITNDQIETYYNSHKKEFIAPEKVVINFVRLSMQDVRKNLKINDEEVKRYYEENQNNFLTPAQWKVAHILFAIPADSSDEAAEQVKQNAEEAYQALQNNPAQFSQWVKTMSADKLSINNDGVLPWIVAGHTQFDKALSDLTTPGQISAPFRSGNGYEIFKLIDYKPAQLKPFEQVKAQIADQLMTELSQARYAQLLEQLTDLSYQSPDSLSPVADELKLTIEKSEPLTRGGDDTEIGKNKQIVNTAFSHDVMELGNNSEPIQLDSDSVIVLRVKKHTAASEKPLNAVRDEIIERLALENAANKAKALGTNLLSTKLDSSEDEKLIVANQLKWQEVDNATRDTDKAEAMINDLAFSLAKPNSVDGRKLMNGDFVIVRLKKISDGKLKNLDKEQQASLAQQIEANYGLMDYDLYVNQLVAKAKVDKH